jgi:hypothetical protein
VADACSSSTPGSVIVHAGDLAVGVLRDHTICGLGRFRTTCTGPSEGREELATHHRVLDVRDAGRLDRPDLLELDLGASEVVEEASAATEEHRNDVQLELV